MSWKALDSKLGTTDDFHYLKNKLQTLDKVYSSYSESGGYSYTRTLGVCLPRALPGSSHAPDQRAFSLTNNPRDFFYGLCFVATAWRRTEDISVWRCYDTPAYEQPIWERNITLLQRDGAGGEELGV